MKNRLLAFAILALSLPLAHGQEAPTGTITYNFSAAAFPIWNFSGPYGFSQQMVGLGGPVGLSYGLSINHSLEGQLSGSGTTIVTIGEDVAAAQYVVSGSVSRGGNTTHAVFTVSLAGSGLDYIGGQRRNFHISLSYNLMVDPDTLTWIAYGNVPAVQGTVSIAGLGSAKVLAGEDFAVALPPGVDGAWSVSMDIVALSRLGGTATISIDSAAPPGQPIYLPTTLVLGANISGNFRPVSELSQLRLSALPGSTPASLDMIIVSGNPQFLAVTGKILGQSVRFSGNFDSD